MQPFTCKLKAENISRSDDPSIRMILALGKDHSILHERRMILVLGSFYFTLTEDDPSARIILFPCKWGLSFHASSQSSYKTLYYPRVQQHGVPTTKLA